MDIEIALYFTRLKLFNTNNMPIKIPARNGGYFLKYKKGESGNPKGRPKQPRLLKEFIKELEAEDDELMFPEDAIEIMTKDGKTFYKLKNSKGGKMFITAYNRAIKGDARWADFLVKMGFAGGYEPIKTENKNLNKEVEIEITNDNL